MFKETLRRSKIGKLNFMEYHTTKNGKKIKLADLELSHLKNILKLIERKAKKGLVIRYGGSGSSAEDMWYDEDIYFGKKAKRELNFYNYKAELERRER